MKWFFKLIPITFLISVIIFSSFGWWSLIPIAIGGILARILDEKERELVE